MHGSIGPPWARAAPCLLIKILEKGRTFRNEMGVYTVAVQATRLATTEKYFMLIFAGVGLVPTRVEIG